MRQGAFLNISFEPQLSNFQESFEQSGGGEQWTIKNIHYQLLKKAGSRYVVTITES